MLFGSYYVVVRLFFLFTIILVTSCSTVDNTLCRINGNLDYLTTDSLCDIYFPDDLLPYIDNKYRIPNVIIAKDYVKKFGKNLNICPPNVAY